jgi:hypothetical protein
MQENVRCARVWEKIGKEWEKTASHLPSYIVSVRSQEPLKL